MSKSITILIAILLLILSSCTTIKNPLDPSTEDESLTSSDDTTTISDLSIIGVWQNTNNYGINDGVMSTFWTFSDTGLVIYMSNTSTNTGALMLEYVYHFSYIDYDKYNNTLYTRLEDYYYKVLPFTNYSSTNTSYSSNNQTSGFSGYRYVKFSWDTTGTGINLYKYRGTNTSLNSSNSTVILSTNHMTNI